MSSYNEGKLERTTARIEEFRQQHRDEGTALIKDNYSAAQSVARILTEPEMHLLQAAYDRISFRDLERIDPTDDEVSEDFSETFRFASILAGQLATLVLVECDLAFPAPTNAAEGKVADVLVAKVTALDPAQSAGLHCILEAARAVPKAVIGYSGWWHPEMLLRLLAQPEYDQDSNG